VLDLTHPLTLEVDRRHDLFRFVVEDQIAALVAMIGRPFEHRIELGDLPRPRRAPAVLGALVQRARTPEDLRNVLHPEHRDWLRGEVRRVL